MSEVIGPNVKRLIAHKMSLDVQGGFAGALQFLSNKDNITASAKKAADWVRLAIQALRQAGEPNPWKDADDDTIAGYFLSEIDKRKAAQ